jgi:hypothetical protein
LRVLAETESEYGPIVPAKQDQRAIAARLSFARPRDPLLDDAAAKVSVDQAALRPRDCISQRLIAQFLLAREALEPAILEYAYDGGSPATLPIYNT